MKNDTHSRRDDSKPPFLWGCAGEKQTQLGDPLPGLTTNQLAQFQTGKQAFQRVFTPQDGLGPLFNANSLRAMP